MLDSKENAVPGNYRVDTNTPASPAAPRWVPVIAVLSIVLGAMNAWRELFSLAQQLLMLMDRGSHLDYLSIAGPAAPAGQLVLNVLLIFAGAALLRRRPAGLTMHFMLGWITTAWVGLVWLATLVQTMTPLGYVSGGRLHSIVLIGWLGRSLILLAYPVFLIVWFAPGKHREEFYASQAPRV